MKTLDQVIGTEDRSDKIAELISDAIKGEKKFKVTDEFGNEYCPKCFKNGILSMNPEAMHLNHGPHA